MNTNILSTLRSALLLACAILLGVPACGDDGAGGSDAGMTANYSLEVLSPPGDSIGLDFSGTSPLRVRYLDDQGQPLVNKRVDFNLLDSGNESTGGASLSAADAKTDAMGVAEIDLVAGAERVNYRVEASAARAPSVLFYIQVSDQGFVNLRITSAHQGARDPSSYDKLQLRIYANSPLRCSDIDFDNVPSSVLQPRTQAQFGDVSEFMNLAADDAYLVVAWAEIGGGRPLAQSCLNLPAERLRSGRTFSALMTLADRSYEFTEPLALETTIDLRPLTSTLTGANAWRQLQCPLGQAELLLDCLTDAQATDGLMDCDGESASPLSTSLQPRRGVVNASGCRLSIDSQGGTSIDALLQAALTAAPAGWPSTMERAALAEGYASLTGELRIASTLLATSEASADHRLLSAKLETQSSDLVDSTRPVIESVGVPYILTSDPLIEIKPHGFTLRYGDIASEHFEALVLEPANVAGLGDALGDQFISGIAINAATGCSALENFVCTQLSLPATCANQCSSLASPLNTHLAAWLPDLLASSVDYELSASAAISDVDNDLRIDSVSANSSEDATQISVVFTTDTTSQLLPAILSGTVEPVAP